MKKLLSLLLSVLLLSVPVLGMAEEATPAKTMFDLVWEQYDLNILTKLGILTEDEVRLLTIEREALAAGRELVGTMQFNIEGFTGDPAADAAIAELLEVLSFSMRLQQDEAAAVVNLSGEDVLTFGYGAKDGTAVASSNLLDGAVMLTEEDFDILPLRLVNAAQAAGLIDSKQAMEYGYQLGMGGAVLFPAFLSAAPVGWQAMMEVEEGGLDLTAWNEALAPVQARMETALVTDQPGDCDEAATMWQVEITPEELNDFLIAALKVIRDNPELLNQFGDVLWYGYPAQEYGAVYERMIDELIISAQNTPLFANNYLRLTNWDDAAGERVMLIVNVLDGNVDEEAVKAEMEAVVGEGDARLDDYFNSFTELKKALLTATHTRKTEGGVTTYETMIGDSPNTGLLFSLTEGEGVWGAGLTALDAGVIESAFNLDVHYQLTRVDGVTSISADAAWTIFDAYGSEATQIQPLKVSLDAQITQNSYRIDASIQMRDLLEEGDLLTGTAFVDYVVNGFDVTGTENVTITFGEKKATATMQLRTQAPQSSVFDSEAVRLADLTDEELAAWLSRAAENAQTWLSEVGKLLPASIQDALNSYGE